MRAWVLGCARCHGCHVAVTGERDSGKPFAERNRGVMSRLSRCHANVVSFIGLIAACTRNENGRIREEKRGFSALYGVGSWRIMIDTHNYHEIF